MRYSCSTRLNTDFTDGVQSREILCAIGNIKVKERGVTRGERKGEREREREFKDLPQSCTKIKTLTHTSLPLVHQPVCNCVSALTLCSGEKTCLVTYWSKNNTNINEMAINFKSRVGNLSHVC